MTYLALSTNLPYSNVLDKLSKRSLKCHAKFESIAANLDDIVEESTDCSHWKCRREQRDVAELN